MNLGKFFKKVFNWVKNLFDKVDKLADIIAPIAIKLVDTLKTINESTTGDILETILTSVIPGTVDDKIVKLSRAWLKEQLPKIATALTIVQNVADIPDDNDKLKAICAAINVSSDDVKNALFHTLSSKFIEFIADGKISWSEAIVLAECYYQSIKK